MIGLHLGVKKMKKNICWRIRLSVHLQKAPIAASSENIPYSRCSIMGEIIVKFFYK